MGEAKRRKAAGLSPPADGKNQEQALSVAPTPQTEVARTASEIWPLPRDAVPHVSPRHRTPEGTEVVDWEPSVCACGWKPWLPGRTGSADDEAEHARRHEVWENGLPLRPGDFPEYRGEGEVCIGAGPLRAAWSPREWWYSTILSWVLRAEDGYDEVRLWPWDANYALPLDRRLAATVRGRPPDDAWRGEPTIVLALRAGRVVGTRILEDVHQPLIWRIGEMSALPDGRLGYACGPVPKPAGMRVAGVTNLWVAHGFRRQGIGTALSAAAARYAGITVRDLAWGTPFSPGGLAGARRYAVNGHLGVYASGSQR